MNVSENYHPKRGLSIPSLTALDERGRVIEADQRRLFRYNVQAGFGADIVFGNGTNGEWNRLTNDQRLRIIEIETDELRKINEQLKLAGRPKVEAWVGVTGMTKAETLVNLEAAIEGEADAGVIAPLSIGDVEDIVSFFHREVTALFERKGKELPLFLYDNAELAVHPKIPHIRTRDVKRLSRLKYICGIKVSASKSVLGHYSKASLHFNEKGAFGIYVGRAELIFDLFRPPCGVIGKIREYWNLHLLHNAMPIGVVSGPANVFPREWQKAWRVCYAGDEAMMSVYRQLFDSFKQICTFEEAGRSVVKLIAGMKYALTLDGVITSDRVAQATRGLSDEQKKIFAEQYQRLKNDIRAATDPLWVSRWEQWTEAVSDQDWVRRKAIG